MCNICITIIRITIWDFWMKRLDINGMMNDKWDYVKRVVVVLDLHIYI